MKIKNKGKVHPSPSSSSSAASDHADVLRLLPAAILALASVLSVEDREVLAYLITRSMDASIFLESSKKRPSSSKKKSCPHNPPLFHCDCFDCYTSYWFRWDSSPNRELIHQVIDAFEDHLTNGENAKKNGNRGKKKDRTTRPLIIVPPQNTMALQESPPPDVADDSSGVAESQDNEASLLISPGRTDNAEVNKLPGTEKEIDKAASAAAAEEEGLSAAFPPMPASNHRGLARMVLPDVMGLLNSRLWNLWGPNV
ncbi:hypothetical protein QN277_026167 [Acacia crassicarpa]|uniref:Uncharacterized protein n=1 Tax=Acacia crassicarpa TaxID=499986 RepID=A0AAE1J9P3_9FABA|nr:hypothetical protein QN277_026167 [Acacia crassicarpa]